MKIQIVSWKDRVWVVGLLIAGLFVLYMFSMSAIQNSGEVFGEALFQEVNANFK